MATNSTSNQPVQPENEIDLIALKRFNKTALIGEVKRNPRKISIPALEKKGETLHKELNDYKITFKGFCTVYAGLSVAQ